MKPPPFAYHRPRTRAEVDHLLAEHGDEAKILAGGQSLLPIMNMRLSAPEHVIDINALEDEPSEPQLDDGVVRFGPLVRQAALERWADLESSVPALKEAIAYTAHPAIRSRGTVVGSIAHADPAAELPAALLALDGEVKARSAGGTREIPARDFFLGALETALEPTEWVEEVVVPNGAGRHRLRRRGVRLPPRRLRDLRGRRRRQGSAARPRSSTSASRRSRSARSCPTGAPRRSARRSPTPR